MNISLSEVAHLIPGFAFKSNDFGSFDTKAIKIGDIKSNMYEKDFPGVDVSKYNPEKMKKYICQPDDQLVAMTGNTIGKTGKIAQGSGYANQRVLIIRPKKGLVTKEYLACIVSSKDFHKHILNHIDSHSAQPNISASSIGSYKLSLPNKEEQNRRSALINQFDTKIELNNRINDYLAA